ncbi:MAG: hypothetical protein WKG07_46790 [Hymenobacter sp.]
MAVVAAALGLPAAPDAACKACASRKPTALRPCKPSCASSGPTCRRLRPACSRCSRVHSKWRDR